MQYKKKRLPINKLRNLLLIICQVLILVACALILAQPAQVLKTQQDKPEVIAIIDSSASMRAQIDGVTRYERAVKDVKDLVNGVFNSDGIVSVILAEETPAYLAQRVGVGGRNSLQNSLNNLLEGNLSCSYGIADLNDAMVYCEDILGANPAAQVYVYTDETFKSAPESVHIENVADDKEWNAAILNAKAVYENNLYYYEVDLACYGRNEEIKLDISVSGVNTEDSKSVTLSTVVRCEYDQPVKVVFFNPEEDEDRPVNSVQSDDVVYVKIDSDDRVFSYQHIFFSLDKEPDSYYNDDYFEIFQGQKEVIKVQYSTQYDTPTSNPFFNGILLVLQSRLKDKWDIQITQVRNEAPATEGFDFYIFEHAMPKELPKDGVVFLCDCGTNLPNGVDITMKKTSRPKVYEDNMPCSRESDSDILNYFDADAITIKRLWEIEEYDLSYEVLLSCDTNPVLLVKDDEEAKIVVTPFSIHQSNLPIRKEMYLLMYNLFEHFIPSTMDRNAYEVNETVTLRSRGSSLTVSSSGLEEPLVFINFPASLKLNVPGTYTFMQETFFGKSVTENVYVKMPASESNIKNERDVLRNPYAVETDEDYYRDLVIFIAAALVALLFAEWLLQAREM